MASYDPVVTGVPRQLDALRKAGDRAGFTRLTDTLAYDAPLQSLRLCLPTAHRDALLELARAELKLRPCFGEPGCSLSVRDDRELDTLVSLGDQLGTGIVRMVVLPGIGRERLHELLRALPLSELKALRMEGNNIRCREAAVQYGPGNVIHLRILGDDRVLLAVHELRSLEELRLCENRLGPAGARAVAPLPLFRLNLRNNGIGDAGAAALSEAVAQVLELQSNDIGPKGAEMLALVDAKVLDLSCNPIGDDGARFLARGNYEGLRLDRCGIGDIGAEALLGLRGGRVLNLRRNPISPAMQKRLRENFEEVHFS